MFQDDNGNDYIRPVIFVTFGVALGLIFSLTILVPLILVIWEAVK
jgi:hypothetical protein